MRGAATLLVSGCLALMAAGAAAIAVPVQYLPNVSLLATIAAALVLGPGPGLIVAALLGLSADVLTGTLLGQQAMLRVIEFAITRMFASQLDLRQVLPLMVFAFCLSLVDSALLVTQSRFFLNLGFQFGEAWSAVIRAGVNGLLAPWAGGAARGLTRRLEEREARREMHLDRGRSVL